MEELRTLDDDKVPFEAPQLMKRCSDLPTETKVKTKAQILHDLPYSQRDIETLMSLPDGYLSEDFGEVRQLPHDQDKFGDADGDRRQGVLYRV